MILHRCQCICNVWTCAWHVECWHWKCSHKVCPGTWTCAWHVKCWHWKCSYKVCPGTWTFAWHMKCRHWKCTCMDACMALGVSALEMYMHGCVHGTWSVGIGNVDTQYVLGHGRVHGR